MFINIKLSLVLPACALVVVLWSAATVANVPPAAQCALEPSHTEELNRLSRKIAAAASVNEAKQLALPPTDAALDAIRNARTLVPFSADLRVAENRLNEFRARLAAAHDQRELADEFSSLMLAGLDNDRAAHVNVGKIGCDYSTGELIAVVVGLILGVIPGIILLIVLC